MGIDFCKTTSKTLSLRYEWLADEAFKKMDSKESVDIIFIRHGESTWNEIFNKVFSEKFP